MKNLQKNAMLRALPMLALIAIGSSSSAQLDKKDRRLVEDSQDARKEFVQTDSLMKSLFANAHAYVVFPTIGKGAFIVGGAGGDGVVFQHDSALGRARMDQLSVGLQAGGQAYREVIFFQNQATLDRFKQNKVEFSGQISAVAAKNGASANAKYVDGVMVFTQEKGGLMFEASVGGQKFKFKPFK